MSPNSKNQLVAAVTKECIVSHGNTDPTCSNSDVLYPMVTLIQLVVTVM